MLKNHPLMGRRFTIQGDYGLMEQYRLDTIRSGTFFMSSTPHPATCFLISYDKGERRHSEKGVRVVQIEWPKERALLAALSEQGVHLVGADLMSG